LGRRQELAALVIVLLALAGCGPARDTPYDVSFAQTPVRITQRLQTPAPSPRRPTRIPAITAPAVGPSVPAPGPGVSSISPGVPAGTPAVGETSNGSVDASTPGPQPPEVDSPGSSAPPGSAGAPTAVSASQPLAVVAPSATAEPALPPSTNPTPVLPEIVTVSPALAAAAVGSATTTAGLAPVRTPVPVATGAAAYPGQVVEAEGRYVTSNSRSARYYYSVDEKSWDRIHADHRVWFKTVDDLLRAFPGRIAYTGRSPRATRTPTPGHSSAP
jgi:hypothetical protein